MKARALASRPRKLLGDPTELELCDVLEQAVKDWDAVHGKEGMAGAWAPGWLSRLMEQISELRNVRSAVGNSTLQYQQAYRCIDKVLDEADPLEAFAKLLDELPSQAWAEK